MGEVRQRPTLVLPPPPAAEAARSQTNNYSPTEIEANEGDSDEEFELSGTGYNVRDIHRQLIDLKEYYDEIISDLSKQLSDVRQDLADAHRSNSATIRAIFATMSQTKLNMIKMTSLEYGDDVQLENCINWANMCIEQRANLRNGPELTTEQPAKRGGAALQTYNVTLSTDGPSPPL